MKILIIGVQRKEFKKILKKVQALFIIMKENYLKEIILKVKRAVKNQIMKVKKAMLNLILIKLFQVNL